MDLLQQDKIEIPSSFPQDKSVYLEQIEVLRPLVQKKKETQPQASTSKIPVTVEPVRKTSSKNLSSGATMLEKLERAAPYNLFFTKIPKSEETLKNPDTITFTDLLCPSLGNLKCSLQINFMIDIMWLMEQYKARNLA